MIKYKKIYIDHFNLSPDEVVLCEVCNSVANDIHHIEQKGMGGSKTKDHIENLIAVCRSCHNKCHSLEISKEEQKKIVCNR